MKHLQEEFLSELQSNKKVTVAEYAALYNKHRKLAIEEELKKEVHEKQATAMGDYYTVTVLSDFIDNESLLASILDYSQVLNAK